MRIWRASDRVFQPWKNGGGETAEILNGPEPTTRPDALASGRPRGVSAPGSDFTPELTADMGLEMGRDGAPAGTEAEGASPKPPSGADWLWRISTAIIARPGPFSRFDGVERVFTVVAGGEVHLKPGQADWIACPPGHAPLRFAGETPCEARHSGPPAWVLNVMTRDGACAEVSADPSTLLTGHPLLALYHFALTPDPAMGLERFDLIALSLDKAGDRGEMHIGGVSRAAASTLTPPALRIGIRAVPDLI